MMEFGPANPGVACSSIDNAWVALHDGNAYTGDVLWIDYADRHGRNYDNFTEAFEFNDITNSARFCLPTGSRYRLFFDSNRRGSWVDLVGNGAVQQINWGTWRGFSSGCFKDPTSTSATACR
jgi:hypothetical protein